MKPLEISFLAAGAVISLMAGGGAARLALVPLDDAYAKGQAVADGLASAGPRVAISAPAAAPAAVYPPDAPPPAAYAMNDTPHPPLVQRGFGEIESRRRRLEAVGSAGRFQGRRAGPARHRRGGLFRVCGGRASLC